MAAGLCPQQMVCRPRRAQYSSHLVSTAQQVTKETQRRGRQSPLVPSVIKEYIQHIIRHQRSQLNGFTGSRDLLFFTFVVWTTAAVTFAANTSQQRQKRTASHHPTSTLLYPSPAPVLPLAARQRPGQAELPLLLLLHLRNPSCAIA